MNELMTVTDNSEEEAAEQNRQQEVQYLTFSLGDETFAVKILNVQEIRTWEMPTPLPRAPEFMKGVINLRGTIMPIIDLRLKLAICEPNYDETTVVIILRTEREGRMRGMGVVVDSMTDVVHIPDSDIKPAPEYGGKIDASYVTGLAIVNEGIVSILSTEAVIDINEIDHGYRII